jgi:hypothetical protein
VLEDADGFDGEGVSPKLSETSEQSR